eukprot:TRINITY_DN12281_c1_g8_i1.p1 TRINITY_DN12281_c1_g8~~TRINITY_DN12281_c1_g8_i1.p1  ORF type:complete len:294 (+),score=34.90 TRINITY_DN12281_c1_g8_i1:129-1010(+)
MSQNGTEEYCVKPQQPGTRNVLRLVVQNASTAPSAPKEKPTAKKAKTAQISWRKPTMMPLLTDLCLAVAHRGVYSSQHGKKQDRVPIAKWFDHTAGQLLTKHRAAIVDCSNQPPGWEGSLTGRQIQGHFERLMQAYKTTQAAEAFASGTEAPEYASDAKKLLEALEAAFKDWQAHQDNCKLQAEHRTRSDLLREQCEASVMAASRAHPRDRLTASTGDRETLPAKKRKSRGDLVADAMQQEMLRVAQERQKRDAEQSARQDVIVERASLGIWLGEDRELRAELGLVYSTSISL